MNQQGSEELRADRKYRRQKKETYRNNLTGYVFDFGEV